MQKEQISGTETTAKNGGVHFTPPNQSEINFFIDPTLNRQRRLENNFYTITISTWETINSNQQKSTAFFTMVKRFLNAFNQSRTINQMLAHGYDFCKTITSPDFANDINSLNGKILIENIFEFFTLALNLQNSADYTSPIQKIVAIKNACQKALSKDGIQVDDYEDINTPSGKDRIKAVLTLIKNKNAKYLKFKRAAYWNEYYKKRGKTSTKYFETEEEQDTNRVIISHGKFIKINLQGAGDKRCIAISLYDTTHEVADDFSAAKGKSIFAVSVTGKIYSSSKTRKVIQHSSFVAGAPVMFAGIWQVKQGRLINVLNYSGHYPSSLLLMFKFLKKIASLGIDINLIKVRRIYQVHDTKNLSFIESTYANFREYLINTKNSEELHGQFSAPQPGELIINFGAPLCRVLNTYGINMQRKQVALVTLLFYADSFNHKLLREEMSAVGFDEIEILDAIFICKQAIEPQTTSNIAKVNCAYILENLFQNEEDNWPSKAHNWLIRALQKISFEVTNLQKNTNNLHWALQYDEELSNIHADLLPSSNGIIDQSCFLQCTSYLDIICALSEFYKDAYHQVAIWLGAKHDALEEGANLSKVNSEELLPLHYQSKHPNHRLAEFLFFSLQYHISGSLSIFKQAFNFGIFQNLITRHVRKIKRENEQTNRLYNECVAAEEASQTKNKDFSINELHKLTLPLLNYREGPYSAKIKAIGLYTAILHTATLSCQDLNALQASIANLFFLYDYISVELTNFRNGYVKEKSTLLNFYTRLAMQNYESQPSLLRPQKLTLEASHKSNLETLKNNRWFFKKVQQPTLDDVLKNEQPLLSTNK